ncbi:hypothetical protein F2Q69_00043163 [Brassica cretica]|uniref:Uncharacterized protein n=1 Tax=Brassica cretica TaxID=69181 RepID=A0A8S9NI88_BRACR|nr:hypothetical protein F2Q69_00043163 [Brassica cretica]
MKRRVQRLNRRQLLDRKRTRRDTTEVNEFWSPIGEDEKQRRETAMVGVTEETKRENSSGPPNYPASRFGPIPSGSCPRGPLTNGRKICAQSRPAMGLFRPGPRASFHFGISTWE